MMPLHCTCSVKYTYILGVLGLQRSICNELFKATSQITESLSAAITMISEPPAPHMLSEIPEYQEGGEVQGEDMQEEEQQGAAAATSSDSAGKGCWREGRCRGRNSRDWNTRREGRCRGKRRGHLLLLAFSHRVRA